MAEAVYAVTILGTGVALANSDDAAPALQKRDRFDCHRTGLPGAVGDRLPGRLREVESGIEALEEDFADG